MLSCRSAREGSGQLARVLLRNIAADPDVPCHSYCDAMIA